jgi:hypothetical protein
MAVTTVIPRSRWVAPDPNSLDERLASSLGRRFTTPDFERDGHYIVAMSAGHAGTERQGGC